MKKTIIVELEFDNDDEDEEYPTDEETIADIKNYETSIGYRYAFKVKTVKVKSYNPLKEVAYACNN